MTWHKSTPSKQVYPPMFIAYDPNAVNMYDPSLHERKSLSLDARLAIEKERNDFGSGSNILSSLSSSPPPGPSRSFNTSRFKFRTPNTFRRTRNQMVQARRANDTLTVCRLPEEVLGRIFLECANLSLEDLEEWSWTNVSHVCYIWRSAALRCSRLWSNIDFAHPKRTAISYDRAKGEPLSIRTTVKRCNQRQLRTLLSTAHQISTIDLVSSFEEIQPLLEALAHPNPCLESLYINILFPDSSPLLYPRPDFPVSYGEQTKLKTVELSGAPLYLLSYRCPTLTNLKLSDLPQKSHFRDLVKLLNNLPQLQYLAISRSMIVGATESHQVHLPNLHCITIEGSIEQVADILGSIQLPPTCQINCSLTKLDNLSDHLWRFCQTIGTHSYSSNKAKPLETLVITGKESSTRFTEKYEINPDFRQSIRIQAFGQHAKPGFAAYDISIGSNNQQLGDSIIITALTGIWRALFLTGVQTLSLSNIDSVTQKTWTQFLRTLPQLRVLDIRGYAPTGLAWALLLDVLITSNGAPRFLVPRLDDVYLLGVDCSSGGLMLSNAKGQINSHSDLDDSRFLDVLLVCFKRRHRNKLLLRSLALTRCEFVVQKVMGECRKYVSHVVWDGRGRANSDNVEARYRNMHQGTPRNDIRHYHRLTALLS